MMTDRTYGTTRNAGTAHKIPDDLKRLDQMDDYEVADGDVDPRGYDLYGRNGEEIGTVENLLASESTLHAHFAIVKTGGWFSGKRFLVPIDNLRFQDEKAYTGLSREQFQNAPEWNDNERDYRRHFDYWSSTAGAAGAYDTDADRGLAEGAVAGQGASEIRVPIVEETAEVQRSRERTGAINLRKRVVEETKHISEPVTRTKVSVDTRDVSASEAAAYDADAMTLREGETLRVPIVEETATVEKTPRVAKEVVVKAEAEQDRIERDVTLRREVVDVDEEGDVDLDESTMERTGVRRS